MTIQIPINEDSPDVLGFSFNLPPRKPLKRFGEVGVQNFTLSRIVDHLREKNLILDYRLIQDPLIAHGAIEMLSRGEISWLV